MPRASRNVLSTDREVKAASPVGERTDFRVRGAPGLQLRVTERGTKSWALAYKSPATGKWAKVSLGRYPAVTLAEARDRALDFSAQIRKGRCPIHDRRHDSIVESFEVLALRYMREHQVRNARAGRVSSSTKEAQRQLGKDILPQLGRLRADAVTRRHVMQVVEAIADRGSFVAADRALGLIRAIYNWGCGTGYIDADPTRGLKKRNAGRSRSRVLNSAELGRFWVAIEMLPHITPMMRDVFRLQLLTAARVGEVAGAQRSELNFDSAIWTIPAIRTKAQREHVLPLSRPAAAVFRAAIDRADLEGQRRAERHGLPYVQSPWVFPSPTTNGPIDAHAATRCIIRNRNELSGFGIVEHFSCHDLRRTVATGLGEMGVAEEVIGRILSHAPRSVAGKHYNHARLLQPMRSALADWAVRLEETVSRASELSDVVELELG